MRYIIIPLALCWQFLELSAQNAEQELQKVLAPLVEAPYLYFENQYLYYEDGATTPTETLDGVFHRHEQRRYARMGDVEFLEAEGLVVSVDHEDRFVTAQPAMSNASFNEVLDVEKLKGLLNSRVAKASYVAGQGSSNAIAVFDPGRPQDKLVIRYDPATWIIKEASVTTPDPYTDPYSAPGKKITIVVRYQAYSTNPKAFPYTLENYVRKEGKRFIANGKCKGYRVI